MESKHPPKNTWYCSTCDFYVFNTKSSCNKCLAEKPVPKANNYESYDPEFNRQVCDYFVKQRQMQKSEEICGRCRQEVSEGKPKSHHNCWKYS